MNLQKNIIGLFCDYFSKPLSISKIQGDASSRQYFRVTGTQGTSIACYDPAFEASTTETYPFLVLHSLLSRHAIPIPALIAIDAKNGLLLLEDCGDLLLQNIFDSSQEHTVSERYRKIIDILIQIQTISGNKNKIPFSMCFDQEKLMFEFDFFIQHGLLDYFSPAFDQQKIGRLRNEFETIAKILFKPQHFVMNHRDFHSRNILLHHDKAVIIDFQDARMGLPQYDAVSLIRDSYIKLNPSLEEKLKAYHYNALCSYELTSMSFDEYLFYFDIMAFQRNIKAIGTFCYQTQVKKNNTFEHSIAPTLGYLPDYINARKELKGAGKILQTLLDVTAR
ncbi:MAG: phosphotransferase [Chlorobiales bacterium]|nr:phosphotransferase [Chlorobiales bacterium]